jgi:flavodoxin
MDIKVLFHSKTGNTKKVAEAISKAVNVPAEIIPVKLPAEPIDLLFIGDGIYMSTIDKKTEEFIKTLNGNMVKYAAIFSTYGGQNKAADKMKELLSKQGIRVADESFSCRGKAWFILNRKHPSEAELNAAAEFAKRIVDTVK